ncbi:alpha mannosidase [Yamadazyma tenuis]|nr:alpha mannosidase [Yamadazyma tenuis]
MRYLRNETKSLFDHAWTSYMKYGFPMDEVRPITCEPYGPDVKDYTNVIRNDVLGNISSTLMDNLDTLVILEKWDDLEMALGYLYREKDSYFDKDVVVQVFEMTIRSLGGLLSIHTILSDSSLMKNLRFRQICQNYDGFLLEMAYDLGKRLIPAFKTTNNIPVPRVNLKRGVKGVPSSLQLETCTSGVTTPVLEMTLLSKLTGDLQFEKYTQLAFWKIWNSRSSLDLLPMTISPAESEWKDSITGIGASIDSFYEYCVKGSILFDDTHMWEVFKTSYKALMTHSVKGSPDEFTSLIFANIGSEEGLDATIWIDSLSGFWPGVQVLSGQLKDAIGTHMVFLKLWDYFQIIPERWNFLLPKEAIKSEEDTIGLEWYPLRPEFVESTYYLYQATHDPMYLQIGETVLNLFKTKFMAPCGFKGVQDVRTGSFQNRMESFVLSETLKYLYLLFDEQNEVFLHSKRMGDTNWVFSTEGHPLWFDYNTEKTFKGSNITPKKHEFVAEGHRENSMFKSFKGLFSTTRKLKDGTTKDITIEYIDDHEFVDPFQYKFDKCEVNPFTSGSTDFMKSSYYELDNLFNLDYEYSSHLYHPHYLPQTSLDNSYIELADDFYKRFTLFNPKLTCSLQSNTEKFDIFIGDKTSIRNNSLTLIPSSNTLWIHEFDNVRLSMELIQKGKIDSRHNYITQQQVETTNSRLVEGVLDPNITLYDASVRITRINGVFVKPEHELVVSRFTQDQLKRPGANKRKDRLTIYNSQVLLDGVVIENLRITD